MMSVCVPERQFVANRQEGPRRSDVVVAFRGTGTRPPLFVVAGLGGDVMIFHELAAALGEDQPVYGLQGVGLDGAEQPLRRIEAIAARYLDEIEAIQPAGPHHLVGWSFGAVIMYELALQLITRGRGLGALVVIDELAPIPVALSRRIAWHVQRFFGQSWRGQLAYVKRSLTRRKNLVLRRFGYHPPVEGLQGQTARRVIDNSLAQYEALRRYRPRPFPGDLTVIKAEQMLGTVDLRAESPTLGWDALVRGHIQTYTVPGSHGGIFSGQNAHVLARTLRQCFTSDRERS
jgi:thioesterase domain-containing protein